MKIKFMLACLLLSGSIRMFGQQVTEFMGIPVDGTKKEMIQKLEEKGFQYFKTSDYLRGQYDGRYVKVFISTHRKKIWSVSVLYTSEIKESKAVEVYDSLCERLKREENLIFFPYSGVKVNGKGIVLEENKTHTGIEAVFKVLSDKPVSEVDKVLKEYLTLPQKTRDAYPIPDKLKVRIVELLNSENSISVRLTRDRKNALNHQVFIFFNNYKNQY